MDSIYLLYTFVCTVLCVGCYYNSLNCGFVFDDMSAVVENKDLRPHIPISNLFYNDFWGTPMYKEKSHKSYRPLCVLTFRINYAISELTPFSYHLTNLVLHLIVTLLLLRTYMMFVSNTTSFVASCLFAVHPVHTEAVTGVVGRAETLSAVFFLAAFISYAKSSGKHKKTSWRWLCLTVILVTMAMLCKEQGITVIGVCCVYEVFVSQQMTVQQCLTLTSDFVRRRKRPPSWLIDSLVRAGVLVVVTSVLLLARVKVMGAKLPFFNTFDNPASMSPTPTRQLTYNYLLSINSWLLLFPSYLCCDWTMGTIPVITSLADSRNLATVALYWALFFLVKEAVTASNPRSRAVIMALSLLILPFIPASNLFFPVGFVVAERILYTPSMGFCLLVAVGIGVLLERMKCKGRIVVYLMLATLISAHALKTVRRNFDWKSEYSIFLSAVKVNKNNAKLWNNVGHALEKVPDYAQALRFFMQATKVQPDDLGAHMNLGRTYQNLGRYHEAESAFRTAMNLLPAIKPGESYTSRVPPNHLNIFLNLANLISRNGSRLYEADKLYQRAVSMRPDYTQAYINRADILIKLGRLQEARDLYYTVLSYEPDNSDAYFNLGVLLLKDTTKKYEALNYFNSALKHNPQHHQSLYNSAILMHEIGTPELLAEAFNRLEKLHTLTPNDSKVFFSQGMLAMDQSKYDLAEDLLLQSIAIEPSFSSALFNLALMLNDNMNRPLDAFTHLQQLLLHHPNHTKGLTLLGSININVKKDLDAAEANYELILKINPHDVQAHHNLCVVYIERGDVLRGEKCLEHVHKLAPNERYIAEHLEIVRRKIQAVKQNLAKQNSKRKT